MADETITTLPENAKIDDKVIQTIIGNAIAKVDGVLGYPGGLFAKVGDVFRAPGDLDVTKGVSTKVNGTSVTVNIKLVTELDKNIPSLVQQITDNVRAALQNTAGMTAEAINIDIVDSITREEYEQAVNPQPAK